MPARRSAREDCGPPVTDRVAQVCRLTQVETKAITRCVEDRLAIAMTEIVGQVELNGIAPEQAANVIGSAAMRWGARVLESAEILPDNLRTGTKNWTKPEEHEDLIGDPDEAAGD